VDKSLEKELSAGEPERQQRAARRIAAGDTPADNKDDSKIAKDPNRVSYHSNLLTCSITRA
jgi:hypothetical protein